ncbi:MAG: hypothetical protein JOY51_04690, partial [Nevskia sp.]|nr:hypothetical protein [Nevskia sp.]
MFLRPLLRLFLLLAWCGLAAPAWAGATQPGEQARIESACAGGQGFEAGGARVETAFEGADYAVGRPALCAWMARAALAVSHYYGRFPVPRVRLVIKPVSGAGAHGGTTYGSAGEGLPLIVIPLGRDTSAAQLVDDWTLTHEMVHLAVPSVPENSHWLEEGIATYVEPIARVQRGELSQARIWADMLHGMRKGLPDQGDAGLDNTPTWGRTYWGGALFCLLAEVRIRAATGNRKGLQDALRGVLAAGGSIRTDWPVEKVFTVGDKATGTHVLSELYGHMGNAPTPGPAELDALWASLGVQEDG